MSETAWLAERFEENRRHLRKVAYRILGSPEEADDALQEAWTRASRAAAGSVDNLTGWLTTTVARVCLDTLRARRSRRQAAESSSREAKSERSSVAHDPEAELLLADSVGPALLIVLETLEPAERVAFVLHDMFDVSFDEIARIVDRSSDATRQLASRARRRVQEDKVTPDADLQRHREVVRAFLAASRDGNFEALLAVLDPDVVLRADKMAVETAAATKWGGSAELASEVRGAPAVAAMLNNRARGVRPALIDGKPGAILAHGGQTHGAWLFTIGAGRIVAIDLQLDPSRLAQLEIAIES
jgi:RNA polymerase sigma factor (sigma-70 family)